MTDFITKTPQFNLHFGFSRYARLADIFGRFFAGSILLFAAMMKAADPTWLSTNYSIPAWGFWTSAVIVFVEASLGIAILIQPHASRLLKIVVALLFGCFATYSLYLWTQSAATCGCFGKLSVPPLVTASTDTLLCALLIMSLFLPTKQDGVSIFNWRFFVSICLGAALATITFHSHREAIAVGQDAISVDNDSIELGDISEHEAKSISHRFILTNRSYKPIRIKSIEHTCACTKTAADQLYVLPGAALPIQVSIDWSGRHGRQMAGVSVFIQDPPGVRYLTVSGNINIGIGISPAEINFGLLQHGNAQKRMVILADTASAEANRESLLIEKTISSAPGITAEKLEFRDRNPDVACFNICIDPDEISFDASSATVLFIETGGRRRVALPIKFQLPQSVEALEKSVRFFGDGPETQVVSFKLSSTGLLPEFSISAANENSDESFIIKSIQIGSDRQVNVSVKMTGNTTRGIHIASLIAKIKSKEVANVSLLKF